MVKPLYCYTNICETQLTPLLRRRCEISKKDMDTKNIKYIEGYDGKYAIDRDGNVHEFYFYVHTCKGTKKHYCDRILKPTLAPNGYLRVCLTKGINGNRKYVRVHRLLAEAFIPNPEHKPFINHKDGNRLNNSVDNLEWVTQKENIHHAIKMGTFKIIKPDKRTAQFTLDGKLVCVYKSATEAAKINDCHMCKISTAARKGRRYKGFFWKYVDQSFCEENYVGSKAKTCEPCGNLLC